MPDQFADALPIFARYQPPPRSRYALPGSIAFHVVIILLALSVRQAVEPTPARPHPQIYLSELVPPPLPSPRPVRRLIEPPKAVLPAPEAHALPPRALEMPHFAAPPVERAVRAPEPPPLPAPAPARPKIVLPEATAVAPAAKPPGQPVTLGSFALPVVTTSHLAPVPAVTGGFAGAANVASKATVGAVTTGGFGKAAVTPSERRNGVTSTGGFGDAAVAGPNRGGKPGGSGPSGPGGFGDAVARTAQAEAKPVQAGAFQTAKAVDAPKREEQPSAESAQSPVTILEKPRPAYTEEARQLKIEGEVVLEVLFAASGRARVIRVVRGLGHGLDESAIKSAENIRFRPAMRGGVPVDATAEARITFQLAY